MSDNPLPQISKQLTAHEPDAVLPPLFKQITVQDPNVSDPNITISAALPPLSKQVTAQPGTDTSETDVKHNVEALRELAAKLEKGIAVKDRSHHLRSYPHCFVGSEAVDWLCRNENIQHKFDASSRAKAVELGQQLCNHGFFRHVVDIHKPFLDESLFYRFYVVPTDAQISDLVSDKWVSEFMAQFFDLDQKSEEWVAEKVPDKDVEAMEAKAWSRTLPNQELKAFKVVVKVKVSISAIDEMVHTKMVERHGEWNATFTMGKYLNILSRDLNVQYWKYNPGAAISNRDFVCVRRRIANDDGSLLLIDRSIETGLMPPLEDCVRGVLPYNVRYLRKGTFKDGSECTEIHYVNETDIRGWMPKALMNKVNVDVSIMELHHIVHALSKEH